MNNKLILFIIGFITTICLGLLIHDSIFKISIGQNVDSVDFLPDTFHDISFIKQGGFLVYQFSADESEFKDFIETKKWELEKVTEPFVISVYNYEGSNSNVSSLFFSDHTITEGWFYRRIYPNGGETQIAFDTSSGKGFFIRTPR